MARQERRQPTSAVLLMSLAWSATPAQVLGLGTDTGDTTPSVLLFFDNLRFLFNVGEGFQRFCVQVCHRASSLVFLCASLTQYPWLTAISSAVSACVISLSHSLDNDFIFPAAPGEAVQDQRHLRDAHQHGRSGRPARFKSSPSPLLALESVVNLVDDMLCKSNTVVKHPLRSVVHQERLSQQYGCCWRPAPRGNAAEGSCVPLCSGLPTGMLITMSDMGSGGPVAGPTTGMHVYGPRGLSVLTTALGTFVNTREMGLQVLVSW